MSWEANPARQYCKRLKAKFRPAAYNTLEKFENAALFRRLGLPSTLNHENETEPSDRRNLKTPALRFSVDEKHFENRARLCCLRLS